MELKTIKRTVLSLADAIESADERRKGPSEVTLALRSAVKLLDKSRLSDNDMSKDDIIRTIISYQKDCFNTDFVEPGSLGACIKALLDRVKALR